MKWDCFVYFVVEVSMPKSASLVQNCLKDLGDIGSVGTWLAYTLLDNLLPNL